jgi:hypothetical protein
MVIKRAMTNPISADAASDKWLMPDPGADHLSRAYEIQKTEP